MNDRKTKQGLLSQPKKSIVVYAPTILNAKEKVLHTQQQGQGPPLISFLPTG